MRSTTALAAGGRNASKAQWTATATSPGKNRLRGGDAPGEPLERQEQAQQVQQALAQLSDEHRSILVLREIDGCDYEAIATALDINIGTVRSRLHRARLQLRDKLHQLYGW